MFGGGWGLYQQVLAGDLAGHFIGEETIDGKKTLGVAVNASFGDIRLYFDPDTHLLTAARYQSTGPSGVSENEQRWSDYRPLAGGQFAYGTVIYRHGDPVLQSVDTVVQINPAIDPTTFAVPAPAPASAP